MMENYHLGDGLMGVFHFCNGEVCSALQKSFHLYFPSSSNVLQWVTFVARFLDSSFIRIQQVSTVFSFQLLLQMCVERHLGRCTWIERSWIFQTQAIRVQRLEMCYGLNYGLFKSFLEALTSQMRRVRYRAHREMMKVKGSCISGSDSVLKRRGTGHFW